MANVKNNPRANNKNPKKYTSFNYSNEDVITKLGNYIIDPEKTLSNQIAYIGTPETIEGVENAFKNTALYFDKWHETKRKVDHILVLPSKEDDLNANEVLEISTAMIKQFFPQHQAVIAVHENTNNIHAHIMLNHFNYFNGKCAHHSRDDTKKYKLFVNQEIEDMQD